MRDYLFFDHAATTRCSDAAAKLLSRFTTEDYGNPSSSHAYGKAASKAISDARKNLAEIFKVEPSQVLFTGGGTESDNMAIYGIGMNSLEKGRKARVLYSSIEHPAVKRTAQSLKRLGLDPQAIPVDSNALVNYADLEKLLNDKTALVSVMQVNNIVGTVLPVEELARRCKHLQPDVLFHSDCVQSFGKVQHPASGSAVDLVSISGHKVHGPKGVGALIVLSKHLLKEGLSPLIWGGDQESGFRSGTQSAGLIAGFVAAAQETLAHREANYLKVMELNDLFRSSLISRKLLSLDPAQSLLRWNSPSGALPHIVNLSFMNIKPGRPANMLPPGLLANLLEERGCLVSTGSACSSQKKEPDPVLTAMGLPPDVCNSSIRVSFATSNTPEQVETLVQAMESSVQAVAELF